MKKDCHLDPEELEFWEKQKRFGEEIDLKLARDLPDDTPDFILKMMVDFEEEAARFLLFRGARPGSGCRLRQWQSALAGTEK